MALPKGFIKKVKLTNTKVGPERRQELLDNIDNQGTFLPRGLSYEDMDVTFFDFIKGDLELTLNGDKVPVIILSLQKWAEFSKTWQHSDEYRNVKMPFITIVRRPDVQNGTNQAGNWNIPGRRGYTYVKVPSLEGGRKGVDVYKIPQPTSVDLTYDVRLFCNRMRDLNKFHKLTQLLFQSRQHYIFPNEHPIPVLLENVSDESQLDDFNKRKFYVQLFEMKLLGYILNEDDFEIIPTVNRLSVSETIIDDDSGGKRKKGDVSYTLNLASGSVDTYTVTAEFNTTFTTITNEINISNVDIRINNVLSTLPFTLSGGDAVEFTITRTDNSLDSSFILNGERQ